MRASGATSLHVQRARGPDVEFQHALKAFLAPPSRSFVSYEQQHLVDRRQKRAQGLPRARGVWWLERMLGPRMLRLQANPKEKNKHAEPQRSY